MLHTCVQPSVQETHVHRQLHKVLLWTGSATKFHLGMSARYLTVPRSTSTHGTTAVVNEAAAPRVPVCVHLLDQGITAWAARGTRRPLATCRHVSTSCNLQARVDLLQLAGTCRPPATCRHMSTSYSLQVQIDSLSRSIRRRVVALESMQCLLDKEVLEP